MWPNFAGPARPADVLNLILALAALIGLASGVLAVEWGTSTRRLSWPRFVATALLAAGLAILLIARPDVGMRSLFCWAVSTGWMAVIDLAVVCLLDPSRPLRRFAPGAAGQLLRLLVVAVVVTLTILMFCFPPFFILLLMILFSPKVGPTALLVTVIAPAGLDLVVRAVAIWIGSKSLPNRSDEPLPSEPVVKVAPDVFDPG